MTARHRAPFLLRLAVRLLPEEVRAEVLGDLIEHWSPKAFLSSCC